MTIEFHGGRLPNDPAKPRLHYAAFYHGTEPYPTSVDYLSEVTKFPMYLNDRIGDCTIAGGGHIIQATSRYGTGTTQTITNDDVLTAYEAVSGYDPKTGANDNGAVMQDVLTYWRKTGLGPHKILAFAEVDPANHDEVRSAMTIFGSLYIGINFPDSAMDQFNNGEPWDVVKGAKIEGGHAIHGGAYLEDGTIKVVTWGAVQEVTPAFWSKYVEEAWVVITPEWLNANGQSPSGFDLYGLGNKLADLTGGVNPFPEPEPTPTPPAPVPSDPDEVLEAFLNNFFEDYTLPKHPHLEAVLRTWLQSRS